MENLFSPRDKWRKAVRDRTVCEREGEGGKGRKSNLKLRKMRFPLSPLIISSLSNVRRICQISAFFIQGEIRFFFSIKYRKMS